MFSRPTDEGNIVMPNPASCKGLLPCEYTKDLQLRYTGAHREETTSDSTLQAFHMCLMNVGCKESGIDNHVLPRTGLGGTYSFWPSI